MYKLTLDTSEKQREAPFISSIHGIRGIFPPRTGRWGGGESKGWGEGMRAEGGSEVYGVRGGEYVPRNATGNNCQIESESLSTSDFRYLSPMSRKNMSRPGPIQSKT